VWYYSFILGKITKKYHLTYNKHVAYISFTKERIMSELGISVYPSGSSEQEIKNYIKLAGKYGYSRIFTSLLEVKDDREGVVNMFKGIVQCGKEHGMKTVVDINPRLFETLNISYDDLSFFAEIGAWGIRLDLGFTGQEEAKMTENEYGLKIETNLSAGTHYIDQILDNIPNRDNLIACHNFYPQRWTGLSREHFYATSSQYRAHNIRTAAFVSAPSAKIGPWPVADGLPTLEHHRTLSLSAQVQELKFSGLIDDILIANAFASEDELKLVADTFSLSRPKLRVVLNEETTQNEKTALFERTHFYRGDVSDYLLRSSFMRIYYKDKDFPPHKSPVPIKRGSVLVLNNEYKQYKGEVQIALRDIPYDPRINVVGEIHTDDLGVLSLIKPLGWFNLVSG
jgi:hypothetical protein